MRDQTEIDINHEKNIYILKAEMPSNHIASQRDVAASFNEAVSKGIFSPYSCNSLFPSFANELRLQTFDKQWRVG